MIIPSVRSFNAISRNSINFAMNVQCASDTLFESGNDKDGASEKRNAIGGR